LRQIEAEVTARPLASKARRWGSRGSLGDGEMKKAMWQLLQEEPSALTCDECFAVMEYYAELLARGGEALLPEIMKHLDGCPSCRMEHHAALWRLVKTRGD
jgi:hypothetical protein